MLLRRLILCALLSSLAPCLAVSAPVAENEFELVLLATPDAVHGGSLFDTCAACHGATGEGAHDGTVPAIGGQHFKVIARQLVDFRHARRWDERMTHFANIRHLADAQDIADVATYISMLTPAGSPNVGQGGLVAQGAQIYARACASCHGPDAEGSSVRAIPRLAGQHSQYLLKQMRDVLEGRRADYSPEHLLLFNRLHETEFNAVADYLSRLSVAPH